MASFSNFKIQWHTRDCIVDGRPGYFHTWEQYNQPVGASPMIGGPPAGVISKLFGIVEFADGIERVDPTSIKFCDEEHEFLVNWTSHAAEKSVMDIPVTYY